MRNPACSNTFQVRAGLALYGKPSLSGVVRADDRVVLISFIQSVVRSFNKHPAPFHERCGEKAGNRAKNHFLKKRRVHGCFKSSDGATTTKIPIVSLS
jgi:hypothetical protein